MGLQALRSQVNDEMLSCRQKKCRRLYWTLLILVLSIIILPPLFFISAAALCFSALTAFIGADSLAKIAPLLPQTPLILRNAAMIYMLVVAVAILWQWLSRRNKKHKNLIVLGYIIAVCMTLLEFVWLRTEWDIYTFCFGLLTWCILLFWFFSPLANVIFFLFSERKLLRANDWVWAEAESSLMSLNILCYKAEFLSFYCIIWVLGGSIGAVPVFVYQGLSIAMKNII